MNSNIEYTNITASSYFTKIQFPPINTELMETFLCIFDLKFIISKDLVKTIIRNRSMSTDQLNALFFLAGSSNMYMDSLKKAFEKIIENKLSGIRLSFDKDFITDMEFDHIELRKKIMEIFSVPDFSIDLTNSFLDEISFPISFEDFVNTFISAISKMRWIYSERDRQKLNAYILSFYKKSSPLQNVAIELHHVMYSQVEKISIIGKKIAVICAKTGFMTREEEVVLQYFVNSQKNMAEYIINSENMKTYNEDAAYISLNNMESPTEITYSTDHIRNSNIRNSNINNHYFDCSIHGTDFSTDGTDYSNYGTGYDSDLDYNKSMDYHRNMDHHRNMDLYKRKYDMLKYFESKYNYENNMTRMTTIANHKLAGINYEIVPNTKSFHSILDCLLQHQLSESSEVLVGFLFNTMLEERFTVGYTDKYNTITVDEHFFMICLANDIKLSYDDFLDYMGKYNKLPYDYPIEIILRIVSRMFNIRIILFTQQLIKLDINNSINETGIVEIYQYSHETCFNIVSKGTTFTPIGNKTIVQNISQNHFQNSLPFALGTGYLEETVNDINDIIEI